LNSYTKPWWAISSHIETIIPALFRKTVAKDYDKEVFTFSDGDITQLNWFRHSGDSKRKLLVIIPGLGSDATRYYIKNSAYYLYQAGYDVLVPDHRGGGIPNKSFKAYHSSNYQDLHEVVSTQTYSNMYLLGYSLGGSIVLNYIYRYPSVFQKAISVCAPFDLFVSSHNLERFTNRLYQNKFVRGLKPFLCQKADEFPDLVTKEAIRKCKTIRDIDELYTAPAHGFDNANDYYQKSSAKYFLSEIKTELLCVNALNDTITPISNDTIQILKENSNIVLNLPLKGGHVGFSTINLKGVFWHEELIIEFLR